MKAGYVRSLFLLLIIMHTGLYAQEWVNTQGPEGGAILELAEAEGKLYARTYYNAYVSEDGGESWALLGDLENILPTSLLTTSFGAHFRTTSKKIMSSYDAETLVPSSEGFGLFDIPVYMVSVGDTLFANTSTSLYKSTNGGESWETVGGFGIGAVLLAEKEEIYEVSFSTGLKVSHDGGLTFETFGVLPQFHLVSDIVKMDDAYVLTDNYGIYYLNEDSVWTQSMNAPGGTGTLAELDGMVYAIYGALTREIYQSADSGKTWTVIEIESETKPTFNHTRIVTVAGKLYALSIQSDHPMVSEDGGLNWTELGTLGLKNQLIRGIFPIEDKLYVTTNDGAGTGQFGYGVFVSADDGETWQKVPIELPEGHNGSFLAVRKFGDDLYATSYAGLFISSDGGENWSVLEGTESWYISDIHITDDLWIMAGSDGFSRVWTSSDGGQNWDAHFEGIGAAFQFFYVNGDVISVGSNTALTATSPDAGVSWNFADADSGLALIGGGHYDIASIGETLYTFSSGALNFYKSTDNGEHWESVDYSGFSGLAGFLALASKNDELYMMVSESAFINGAIVTTLGFYKSTDGETFVKDNDLVGIPMGYGNPYFTFSDEQIYLGFTGTPVFKFTGTNVSIDEVAETVSEFKLNQNYPNPFNPSTSISFQLPVSGLATLKVYDMLGREVATLVDARMSAGSHTVNFDASRLSSGMYIYRLQAGNNIQTRKMLLVK